MDCDYSGNGFLHRNNVTVEECGQTCIETDGCTHFSYTPFDRTCWMKNGTNIKLRKEYFWVCGIVRPCKPLEFNKCKSHNECCSGFCDNNFGNLTDGVCTKSIKGLINLQNSHYGQCQKDFQAACLTQHNDYRDKHNSQHLKAFDILQRSALQLAKNLAVDMMKSIKEYEDQLPFYIFIKTKRIDDIDCACKWIIPSKQKI